MRQNIIRQLFTCDRQCGASEEMDVIEGNESNLLPQGWISMMAENGKGEAVTAHLCGLCGFKQMVQRYGGEAGVGVSGTPHAKPKAIAAPSE